MAKLPKVRTPKSLAPKLPSVPQDAAKAGYAVLGAGELAVEHARVAQDRLKAELSRERLSRFVTDQLEEQKRRVSQRRSEMDEQLRRVAGLPRQARQIPGAAMEQGLAVSSRAEHTYDDLASRGRVVAHRLKIQQGGEDTGKESADVVEAVAPVEVVEAIEVVEVDGREQRPAAPIAAKTSAKKKSAAKPASGTPKPSTTKAPAASSTAKKSPTAKKSASSKRVSTGEGPAS